MFLSCAALENMGIRCCCVGWRSAKLGWETSCQLIWFKSPKLNVIQRLYAWYYLSGLCVWLVGKAGNKANKAEHILVKYSNAPAPQWESLISISLLQKAASEKGNTRASMLIRLESTRKYIPISRMSPNHVQSRCSPELIFSKKCTNPFAFFQWKVACREYVKTFSRRCPKKIEIFG